MAEAEDKKIAELERDLEGLREMLYGLLLTVNEPVIIDVQQLKEAIQAGGRMIDISLDKEKQQFLVKLVDLSE
jgi:hypothetical protein